MKKSRDIRRGAAVITLALLTGTVLSPAYGQNMWDAYRYSRQFNEGTARSVAMGNAMVALGGDMGAISINPAASGVYTYNELIFTPSITVAENQTEYLGKSASTSKTKFGVPNFGFVTTFNTKADRKLVSWNLAIAFNKTNNFTDRMSATGLNAKTSYLQSLAQGLAGLHATNLDMNSNSNPFFYSDAPWQSILAWNTSLLDTLPDSGSDYYAATENLNGDNIEMGGPVWQYYTREASGNISEAAVNFGGNISNKLFFGINVGIVNVWYKYNEFYSEKADNSNDFDSGFVSFTRNYRQKTSGTGVNLKAGLIYLPFEGLRIGASISTPTWLYLTEEWEERVTSGFNDGYSQNLPSPLGRYDYRLNTPFRWNVGLAYTFGKFAAVSVDYESADYSKMKLTDYDYPGYFAEENGAISRTFRTSNIFRAGAEFRITPEVALRAGYQYYEDKFSYNDNIKSQTGSLGVGYAGKSGFFVDAAYCQNLKKSYENFTLYDDIEGVAAAPVGITGRTNWKLLLSIGFRF